MLISNLLKNICLGMAVALLFNSEKVIHWAILNHFVTANIIFYMITYSVIKLFILLLCEFLVYKLFRQVGICIGFCIASIFHSEGGFAAGVLFAVHLGISENMKNTTEYVANHHKSDIQHNDLTLQIDTSQKFYIASWIFLVLCILLSYINIDLPMINQRWMLDCNVAIIVTLSLNHMIKFYRMQQC